MGRELESSTLPDDNLATSLVADLADDDIDVAFVGDDDVDTVLEPKDKVEARRGQNEDDPQGESDPGEEDDGSDPDLSDIKDKAARERVMAARQQAQAQA